MRSKLGSRTHFEHFVKIRKLSCFCEHRIISIVFFELMPKKRKIIQVLARYSFALPINLSQFQFVRYLSTLI